MKRWILTTLVAAAVGALATPALAEGTDAVRIKVNVDCVACTTSAPALMKISRVLRKTQGVASVKMNLAQNEVITTYDPDVVTSTELGIKLTDLGRAKTYKSRTVISCTFTPSLTQSPIVTVDEEGVKDAFPSASSG